MRIKMLENMNSPAIGYYYLCNNGCIKYMFLTTANADGGKKFLETSPKVVAYWFVETADDFSKMVEEVRILNEHIHQR